MKKIFFSMAVTALAVIFFFQLSNAQSWSINGNSGTTPPTNFLGTTDNKGLAFKTNNTERMRITNNGKVGIGVTSPSYKLDVAGDINLSAGNLLRIGGTPVFKDNVATNNLLIGESTSSSSSGSANTTVGILSLSSISSGTDNTAIGYNALHSNSSGIVNTAVGFQALISNTSGSENIAIGENSLFTTTNGIANIGIGSAALFDLTNGQGNTAIGSHSLQSVTTGFDNTALGTFTDVTSGNFSNSIAIGSGTMITASDQARIGNVSTSSIGGYVDWSNISDGRFKKNIQENVKGLAFIKKLKPITYTLDIHGLNNFIYGEEKSSADQSNEAAVSEKEKIVYSGFIAQEVEKSANEIGYDFSGVDAPKNDKDVYGLRYADFVVPLVKAVQELDQENGELEIKNGELNSKVDVQQNEIDNLKSEVQSIKSEIKNPQSQISNDGFARLQTLNTIPETILGQNIPNPFDNSTLIPFRIPKDCHDASIMITNTSTSEVISVIPISCNEDHISVDAGTLASGTYSYTLYVDGKMIDTKSMVLTK